MIKHERNKDIEFDPDRHVYTYKGYKVFDGVTSWIGKYHEPFNAPKVARKLAKYKDKTAQEFLEEWNQAREYGNYVHENIERYVENEQTLEIDEIKQFKKLLDKHDLEPIACEWVVYDENISKASAIDLLCKNHQGKYVIIDVKTMKKPIKASSYKDKRMFKPLDDLPDSRYFKQSLQVNIYKYWLENKYDMDVSNVNYIMRLRDDVGELIPVVDLTGKVKKLYDLCEKSGLA